MVVFILVGISIALLCSNSVDAAVLDRETGLVWEQSPVTTTDTWIGARRVWINKNLGGRKGWRLPSTPELASLVDPNATSSPFLPAGHPFTNVQSAFFYWAATTNAVNPTTVTWVVNFNDGDVTPGSKASSFNVWCAHGGMDADKY